VLVFFHHVVAVLGVVVEIWWFLLLIDVTSILPIFRRQVFAPLEILLQESDRVVSEVELRCHRQVLLCVQPITFNVKVDCLFKQIDKAGLDLTANRYKIMVGRKYCLSVHYHRVKRHGIRLVLIVIMSDVAAQLVLFEVEVFLLQGVRRIHIKRIQLSLLNTRLLHQDHIQPPTEFLRLLSHDIVYRTRQQNRPVISVSQLVNSSDNLTVF
jgi:hypothetical protein